MDLQHTAGTVMAVSGAAMALLGWHRLVWPRIKAAWTTRPMAEVRAGIVALRQDTANMRRLGEEEARKGTERGAKLDQLGKDVLLLRSTVNAQIAADPSVATFEASPAGLLTEASKTYLRWTGRSFADLERWGWVNVIHVDDRDTVRREWDAAVRDQRQSVMRFRMLGADGSYFDVVATATPIPEGSATCEKFVGVIHRQDQ